MQTPSQATWLRRIVGSSWLKFTYDYSHFQLQRLSLKDTMTSMMPYCSFVHVKDASGTIDRPEFFLPGDKALDYDSYFRLLKAMGYQGSITVEVSAQIHRKPGYEAVEAASRSYKFLSRAMEDAGLRLHKKNK